MLELGLLDEHIARLTSGYQRKLAAMLAAADAFLTDIPGVHWHRPAAGCTSGSCCPRGWRPACGGALWQAALAEHVIYVPGEYCFAGRGAAGGAQYDAAELRRAAAR